MPCHPPTVAYSLGAACGFNYKDGEWAEAVKAATPEGAGVDIVLDCVGMQALYASLHSVE